MSQTKVNVEFIRLFFRAPIEEEIAFRWARRLGDLIGTQVLELRPETTLAQMLDWADAKQVASIDFAVVFEPELRREFAPLLDEPDRVAFRGMVEHVAQWYAGSVVK